MADLGLGALSNLNLSNLNGLTDLLSKDQLSINDNETTFSDILSDTFGQYQTNEAGNTIDTLKLLTGNTEDLSSTMIATEKAELALNLTISVRNKAISAYNQIMNMQI